MGNNPSKSDNGQGPSSPTAATQQSHPSRGHNHRREKSIRRNNLLPSNNANRISPPTVEAAPSSTPPSNSSLSLEPRPLPSPRKHTSSGETGLRHKSSKDSGGGAGMGAAQSHQVFPRKPDGRQREAEQDAQSDPVSVPGRSSLRGNKYSDASIEPSAPSRDTNYAQRTSVNFPGRLPLAVVGETHTPGSPILTAADFVDEDGYLPHRASLLSHTTADEDDDYSSIAYEQLEETKGKTVPTPVSWSGGGNKVYITGSHVSWSKKFRMHRDPETKVFSVVLDLPPGTHHVKFIVDGDMQLSNDLPTSVDYTNVLVNYIEVSADDIPRESTDSPEATSNIPPPTLASSGVEVKDHEPGAVSKTPGKGEDLLPVRDVHYGDGVPGYLTDLDRDEKSSRFQRAANRVQEIPAPPSLPLFLGKSILNGTTPIKDDSSILNTPNHTMLNHLATSSIRHDVLATSLTTRYKRKYVTLITYRPTTTDQD